MTGEGTAAGVAAGTAAGLAVGLAMKEEEAARKRRRSHMGEDQILIETKQSPEEAAEGIASMHGNWKAMGWNVCETGQRGFSGILAVIGGTIAFFGLLVSYMIIGGWDWPLTGLEGAYIFAIITIAFGLLGFKLPDESRIKYIRISQNNKTGSLVLLKIYDDEGRRNLDEDEIRGIIEVLAGRSQ